ncbi:MAG: hypothetical protein ACI9BF_000080 [Candidatus Paceibacteria bacterium]|jgi:hypothetical protein
MKILKGNFEILLLAIGIVFIWRAIWGLSDLYLFPDNPELSYIVSASMGIIILLLTGKKPKSIEELL